VSTVTRPCIGQLKNHELIPSRDKILFSEVSRLVLGAIAKVRNERSCTFTPPICLRGIHRISVK